MAQGRAEIKSALQAELCTSLDQKNSIKLPANREVRVAAECDVGSSHC